jgi:asparagine synthase (glutamine-hydrolysing)
MRAARREGVPVLLDGQGGDEVLCGYRKYAFFYLRHLFFQRKYFEAAQHMLDLLTKGDRGLLDWRRGVRYLPQYFRKRRDNIVDLLRPAWKQMARRVWAQRMKEVRALHEHQLGDLIHWSLPALLRYEDRNSMAHSIETRLPFLDYRFVEYCLGLSESFFFRRGRTKRVLVEALGNLLPESVRDRRTKMGFETPSEVWMEGQLGEFLEKRVRSSARLPSILDPAAAGSIFLRYRNGERTYSDSALFRIGALAVWLDIFRVDVG